jgi:peptide/nickel transport system permease protein
LIQGIFFFISIAVLMANFIVDMMYGFIDPRTRQA